ncbi:hypothetical protein PBCVNEJV1_163L [Paramecium bursaria Chlorella virus NE-JV-1]|nr:hypothetical protein PBCVNEJV1_163L [Paramecium bursaria Chlorella virus NE-JV-1]
MCSSVKMNFVKSAERFIELHKNLIENAKTTKEMRKEKAIIGKELLEYMIKHKIADHPHDGFEIVAKERDVKNKLSVEMIEGMLENFVNENLDQEKINKIINAIIKSEESDEKKMSLAVKKTKDPRDPKKTKTKKTDDA